MSLIEQRNRFLSFAFAASDILVETDLDGVSLYAAGAAGILGEPSLDACQANFIDRLDHTSRPIVRALLRRAQANRRIGPARVTTQGREATLSGWMLDANEGRIRWTLSFDALDAPDELEPERFEVSAADALKASREQGLDMRMSVLRLKGAEGLSKRVGQAAASRLYTAIQGLALEMVGDHGVARQVESLRYALIHTKRADTDGLVRQVKDVLAAEGIDGVTPEIETVRDAPDLEPGLTVQAFLHAVNTAAEDNGNLDIQSLQSVAESMMAETTRRMAELRTTIAGRVMEPYAQPVVDLTTREVHHYELLLRLPGGTPLQDDVGFAESTGLIYEIDMSMTEIAISFLREDFDRPSLAVNLSGKSLCNSAFGKRFLALLADAKIDRSRLCFEITETANITATRTANTIIQRIRERGHAVCLDDFGAGSAGFHYLRDFEVDQVKIDGHYIREMSNSQRERVILQHMIGMCSDLGAETVAEMIETEDQARLLKGMNVTYGQGYLFGRPQPLKDLAKPGANAGRAA
ncbi:EAL domain-containing protein [Maricaulis sp. D1M11]|uniref:EAL domain-containing protein n=1 Tax=Maricaulis sp. D1M11 TaxID=3076117 RepID=UPI0039B61D87